MISLYDYYLEQGIQDDGCPFEDAGQAACRILKGVFHGDRRIFVQDVGRTVLYYWTGEHEEGEW